MRRVRWWSAFLAVLIALSLGNSALAATAVPTRSPTPAPLPPDIQWEAVPLYGNLYTAGKWLPIQVTITNSGVDRQFTVLAEDHYALQLDVPGGGKKTAILHYYPGNQVRIKVELFEGEQKLDTQRLAVKATSGSVTGNLLDTALPAFKNYPSVQIAPASLATNAASLDMLSLLVVNGPTWNALNAQQQAAVRAWIQQGGVMLLPGQDVDQFPEELRPADTGAPLTFPGAAIAQRLHSAQDLDDLSGVQLFPVAPAEARLKINDTPLLAYLPLGKGGVFASAIVPGNAAFMRWSGFQSFIASLTPKQNDDNSMFGTEREIRESAASSFLTSFPELDLPPLQLLLILLGIYILLVGPINHFVLKRLDRMALAWITIPALTLIFAILAYGIGAQQRGNDIIVNDLVVIEQFDDYATGYGYAGVFSPTNSQYTIHGTDTMLIRPFNLPWGGNQIKDDAQFSSLPASVTGFEVQQWSMSMLSYALPLTTTPQLVFNLRFENNTIIGNVINRGTAPVDDAALIMGNRAQKLGVLQPNQQVEVNLRLGNSFDQNSPSYVLYQKELDAAYQTPQGPSHELLARTQAVDTALAINQLYSFQLAFVGFLPDEIPTISLPGERYNHSQTRIIVSYPHINFATGDSVAFDSRWTTMTHGNANGFNDVCGTFRGMGISMNDSSEEVLIDYKKPLDDLNVTDIKLTPVVDGPIKASDLNYEVFNWQTNQWVPYTLERGSIILNQPMDYFQNGQVQLRYTTDDNLMGFWGCFSPGIVIQGTLQ